MSLLRRALYGFAAGSLFTFALVVTWPSEPAIEPEAIRPFPAPFPPPSYPDAGDKVPCGR